MTVGVAVSSLEQAETVETVETRPTTYEAMTKRVVLRIMSHHALRFRFWQPYALLVAMIVDARARFYDKSDRMTLRRHQVPLAHVWSKRIQRCILKILGICGSLQSASANLELLHRAARLMPDGVELSIYDGLRDLPHFNPDIEKDGVPAAVMKLREEIASSAALIIACPEYGFSLPGSLKNAIDWLIGSGELESKIIAVTASTASPERGRLGLEALCGTLRAVKARMVGGVPIARGPAFDSEVHVLVNALIDAARRDT
jgi:chromate reductase